jgi:uncharacterized membrane protein
MQLPPVEDIDCIDVQDSSAMTVLVLGLILFLGTHSTGIIAAGWRDRMRARLGEGGWKGAYSVVSLIGFVMICYGFGLARRDPIFLYAPPIALRYLAIALMLPVFPLLFAASLPGRIKTALKHPMLAGVKFWALAHLLANGMLADVLLFGGFLVWAIVDRISWKRRPPQILRMAPARAWNDALAIVAGLTTYALFIFWAHAKLFGVSPLG